MSDFKTLIRNDMQLMRSIRNYCASNVDVDSVMRSIVSKNPFNDIVLILYFFVALGIYDIGRRHFWLVVLNLSVSFLLRKVIEAKRPVEYDRTLQPMTDTGAESYGFPSLESHMAVVILGHYCVHYKSVLLFVAAIALIALIGFSRVYSRSRFPHQIVGSWLTGLIGLYAGLHCCDMFGFHLMKHGNHICCVIAVVASLLCNFALNVENNDSRVIGVPKSEFIRVISGIINASNAEEGGKSRAGGGEDEIIMGQGSDPTRLKMERDAARTRKGERVKRDSFFFMQRAIEQRDQPVRGSASRNSAYYSPRTIEQRNFRNRRNRGVDHNEEGYVSGNAP